MADIRGNWLTKTKDGIHRGQWDRVPHITEFTPARGKVGQTYQYRPKRAGSNAGVTAFAETTDIQRVSSVIADVIQKNLPAGHYPNSWQATYDLLGLGYSPYGRDIEGRTSASVNTYIRESDMGPDGTGYRPPTSPAGKSLQTRIFVAGTGGGESLTTDLIISMMTGVNEFQPSNAHPASPSNPFGGDTVWGQGFNVMGAFELENPRDSQWSIIAQWGVVLWGPGGPTGPIDKLWIWVKNLQGWVRSTNRGWERRGGPSDPGIDLYRNDDHNINHKVPDGSWRVGPGGVGIQVKLSSMLPNVTVADGHSYVWHFYDYGKPTTLNIPQRDGDMFMSAYEVCLYADDPSDLAAQKNNANLGFYCGGDLVGGIEFGHSKFRKVEDFWKWSATINMGTGAYPSGGSVIPMPSSYYDRFRQYPFPGIFAGGAGGPSTPTDQISLFPTFTIDSNYVNKNTAANTKAQIRRPRVLVMFTDNTWIIHDQIGDEVWIRDAGGFYNQASPTGQVALGPNGLAGEFIDSIRVEPATEGYGVSIGGPGVGNEVAGNGVRKYGNMFYLLYPLGPFVRTLEEWVDDIKGTLILAEGRLIKFNSAAPDDFGSAHYMVRVGADYRNMTQGNTVIHEAHRGRWKELTVDWALFASTDIDIDDLEDHVPPGLLLDSDPGVDSDFIWSYDNLPATITFDSDDGELHGIPTTAETRTIVAHLSTGTREDVLAGTLVIDPSGTTPPSTPDAPRVLNLSLPGAQLGVPYSKELQISYVNLDAVTAEVSGLPPGLTMTDNYPLVISGTPTLIGDYTVRIVPIANGLTGPAVEYVITVRNISTIRDEGAWAKPLRGNTGRK